MTINLLPSLLHTTDQPEIHLATFDTPFDKMSGEPTVPLGVTNLGVQMGFEPRTRGPKVNDKPPAAPATVGGGN